MSLPLSFQRKKLPPLPPLKKKTHPKTPWILTHTAIITRGDSIKLCLHCESMSLVAMNGITVETGMRAKRDYILFIQTGPFCYNMECWRMMLWECTSIFMRLFLWCGNSKHVIFCSLTLPVSRAPQVSHSLDHVCKNKAEEKWNCCLLERTTDTPTVQTSFKKTTKEKAYGFKDACSMKKWLRAGILFFVSSTAAWGVEILKRMTLWHF